VNFAVAGRIAVDAYIIPAFADHLAVLDHQAGTIAASALVHLLLAEIDGALHEI